MSRITVLVTGATGHQGGAVAARLLARGHRVRAMTRKPKGQAARKLQTLGAELVYGDFDDRSSIEHAATGVDAVFALSTPFEGGAELEYAQGRTLMEALATASPKHVVYSSAAGASAPTGIPHYESKRHVEQHLASLGLPYTVVAPSFFMENVLSPMMAPGLRAGLFALPLPAARPLQVLALEDLAAFTALVFEARERFLGKRVELASDELSPLQVAARLTEAFHREIRYLQVPMEVVRSQSEDVARLFEWLSVRGRSADLAALRRDYPEVAWHAFSDWLALQNLGELQPGPAAKPAPTQPQR